MGALGERIRRHIDAIDPRRAYERLGVQAVCCLAGALVALWCTPLWPVATIWAGFIAVMMNLVLLPGMGSFRHEAAIATTTVLCHLVAIAVGTLAPGGTFWFFVVIAILGFSSGLAAVFGPTGRLVGATTFIAFALAASLGATAGSLSQRVIALGVGAAAVLAVMGLVHAVGRAVRWGDFGAPPLPRVPFDPRPAVDRGDLLHGLRFGVTALAAAVFADLLGVAHPVWVLLTVAVVLQRRLGDTLVRSAQRIGGTVVGAVLGWAIASGIGPANAVWLLALLPFAFAGIYLYSQPNYLVGIAFVTMFVVFALALLGQPVTASALERLGDTLLAAAIGVVVSLILFPERAVFGARTALADFFDMAGQQYRRALDAALGGRGEDFDRRAEAFERQATATAREVATVRWETLPGRRISGLRREMYHLIDALFVAIRDLGGATDRPGEADDQAAIARLQSEADRFETCMQELASAVRHARAPGETARDAARDLLADAERDGGPFGERRRRIFAAAASFADAQARRFPGAGRAGPAAT